MSWWWIILLAAVCIIALVAIWAVGIEIHQRGYNAGSREKDKQWRTNNGTWEYSTWAARIRHAEAQREWWHGKYTMVKHENNQLRRKFCRSPKGGDVNGSVQNGNATANIASAQTRAEMVKEKK